MYTHTTRITLDIGSHAPTAFRNALWKNYNTHSLILIKFWLNKGVNYTQDFMVLTLTNNKNKPNTILFWKNCSPCGPPDFEFLIAHMKFYSHWQVGEWISTTLLFIHEDRLVSTDVSLAHVHYWIWSCCIHLIKNINF